MEGMEERSGGNPGMLHTDDQQTISSDAALHMRGSADETRFLFQPPKFDCVEAKRAPPVIYKQDCQPARPGALSP